MSSQENRCEQAGILPPSIGNSEFAQYCWEDVLCLASKPVCSLYSTQFFMKAAELGKGGDNVGEDIFKFLGAVASMRLQFGRAGSPFAPDRVFESRRSAILEDFQMHDLEVLGGLLTSTKDPGMRARFADMLWSVQKDRKALAISAEAYLEHFRRLSTSDDWAWDFESLARGVALARLLGRNSSVFHDYSFFLAELLKLHSSDPKASPCLKVVDLLLEHDIGDPSQYGNLMSEMGDKLDSAQEFFLAQNHYQQAAKCYFAAKEEPSARANIYKKGESLLRQAESVISGQGYTTGAHFLAKSLECFRRAPPFPPFYGPT